MYCPCGSLPNELGRFWAATGSKAKARYCDLGESDALGAHMGWANKTLLRVQYCTWSWLLCSEITREAQAYGTTANKNLHMLAVHVARLAHGDECGAHLGVRKPPARPRERLTATHHQTMTASHGWLLFGTVCQILATSTVLRTTIYWTVCQILAAEGQQYTGLTRTPPTAKGRESEFFSTVL